MPGLLRRFWLAAYDRSPRYGGKQVATIRLTEAPYCENTADAPDDDFRAEGLRWMLAEGIRIQGVRAETFWINWRWAAEDVYVVRFEVVDGAPL